jgi:hypothetical protein
MKANKSTPSTQSYIPITEIKDDTMIMKDGSLRAIILVSSMNFSLKSEDEQNAVIQGYMQFLNSFDFPLQITIQSRKLDIDKYLEDLARLEKQQPNDLLRLQMKDYRQFVGELVELADIMSKKFFVTVSYYPFSDKKQGFTARLGDFFAVTKILKLSQEQFLKRKHFLDQRVSNVISGLASLDLQAVRLDTQSLIELLYNTYNPETSESEKIVKMDELQIEK